MSEYHYYEFQAIDRQYRRPRLELWRKVNSLVEDTKPSSYDEAIRLLIDLRALDARLPTYHQPRSEGGAPASCRKDGGFRSRIEELRRAHTNKPAFLRRLQKQGL